MSVRDHLPHAPGRETRDHLVERNPALLEPSLALQPASAQIETHDERFRSPAFDPLADKLRLFQGNSSENQIARAERQELLDILRAADAASNLDRHLHCLDDSPDGLAITPRAVFCTLQVDDVQTAKPGRLELKRLPNRVLAVGRLGAVIAFQQPDALACRSSRWPE